MKKFKASVAVAAVALTPAFAQAALIDMGDFTRDTATGLDWLDVTKTLNLSFNDVVGQMGPGGQFEGWRHATTEEIGNLFHNSGEIPVSRPTNKPDVVNGVLNLQNLMGFTTRFGIQTSNFISGTPIEVDGKTLYRGAQLSFSSASGSAYAFQQTAGSWAPETRTSNIGQALTRDSASVVPEPSAWQLGLAGLLMLGAIVARNTLSNPVLRTPKNAEEPKTLEV